MKTIRLFPEIGSFGENKDIARDIRKTRIMPALEDGNEVILDFSGIEGVTQSFIHALISELIRKYGIEVIDEISFKNCNEHVQKIIRIVVDYMQESEL